MDLKLAAGRPRRFMVPTRDLEIKGIFPDPEGVAGILPGERKPGTACRQEGGSTLPVGSRSQGVCESRWQLSPNWLGGGLSSAAPHTSIPQGRALTRHGHLSVHGFEARPMLEVETAHAMHANLRGWLPFGTPTQTGTAPPGYNV